MNNYIYEIKNLLNNKRYFGQTKDTKDRWSSHKSGNKQYIDKIIKSDGIDNFTYIIIETNLSVSQASIMEKYYIDVFNTTNPNFGYNISPGGESVSDETRIKISNSLKGKNMGEANQFYGKQHSDITKEQMSKAKKGENHPFFGKPLPEQHRKNIGNALKGKQHTENTKEKISKSRAGKNTGVDHHFFGKHRSEETKQQISNSRKGKCVGENNPFFEKTHSEETRKIISEKLVGTHLGQGNPFFGKSHSDETLKIISEANKRTNPNKNFFSKLKEEQIILILNDNRKPKIIAQEYGVSKDTIYKIKSGKIWVHLKKLAYNE